MKPAQIKPDPEIYKNLFGEIELNVPQKKKVTSHKATVIAHVKKLDRPDRTQQEFEDFIGGGRNNRTT